MAAAVARVLADTPELGREQVTEPDSPTRFGDSTTFYRCSVAALSRRMAPGTVDLIAAFPPADARLATFSDLAALATRALTREWVMMVAVIDTDRLPEMLARMRRYGPEWIMEFSLLFTTPVATSGEPHRIALRRVALLVYGKPGARLSGKEDVIQVRAPGRMPRAAPLDSRMEWCWSCAVSPPRVRCYATTWLAAEAASCWQPSEEAAPSSAQTRTSGAFTGFWSNWLAL